METYIETHEPRWTIYTLERARKGSRKLIASAMPITPISIDRRIALRRVPRAVLRRAREALEAA